MARLNDTAAIAEAPARSGQEHSVSTRKIDNGYVVRQSTYSESTGEYKSSESFMKEPPRITAPGVKKGRADGPSDLATAMRYLNNDR